MLALARKFKPHVWMNAHSGMEALFMPYDHLPHIPAGEVAQATLQVGIIPLNHILQHASVGYLQGVPDCMTSCVHVRRLLLGICWQGHTLFGGALFCGRENALKLRRCLRSSTTLLAADAAHWDREGSQWVGSQTPNSLQSVLFAPIIATS